MTLRDRQRVTYYNKLDLLFPGLRVKYENAFGDRYSAPARHARQLGQVFADLCRELGLATKMPVFSPTKRLLLEQNQPTLF
jgi:hypothetical protein